MENMIPAISGRGNEPEPYTCALICVCVCVCLWVCGSVFYGVLSAGLFMRMFVLSIGGGGPDCGRVLRVWSVSLRRLQLWRRRPARRSLLRHR